MADDSATRRPGILFTAFEPSGDAHAAPVIRSLRERRPDLPLYGWGGPKMREAGATLVQETAADAAMGLNALAHVRAVRREIARIRQWSRDHPLLAHVAVDAPAANFPICKFMRAQGTAVVHLVAPQLWAWAPWRARKLRARTNLVLCLLPFEEAWFRERNIPARFVGHPRMNRTLDTDAVDLRARALPQGAPHVALFPGSRRHEVTANIRLLVDAFVQLRAGHAGAIGVVVSARPELVDLMREKVGEWPRGLTVVDGDVDAAVAWADLCLAVSGTVTLDIARQRTPMVGVYRTTALAWLVARFLLRTPVRLLPNLVAQRAVVPEFVPHCGGAAPVVRAASAVIEDAKTAAAQVEALDRVCASFDGKDPAGEASRLILDVADGVST